MNDYGMLAERLRVSDHTQDQRKRDLNEHFDPGAFFEEVKQHIVEEISKANAELYKRRLVPIERVLVPCYLGRLCLTFGTIIMCCVEFDAARGRITAAIIGPPNRWELARREYLLSHGRAKLERSSTPHPDRSLAEGDPEAVACDIVAEILETGIRMSQKQAHPPQAQLVRRDEPHLAEFWISLASLLRSYTALHGSNRNSQAEIEAVGNTITVRHAKKSLVLQRHFAMVTWTRENGSNGTMEFTDHGTLRCGSADEPMDLLAEQWARELMHPEPLPELLVQIGKQ